MSSAWNKKEPRLRLLWNGYSWPTEQEAAYCCLAGQSWCHGMGTGRAGHTAAEPEPLRVSCKTGGNCSLLTLLTKKRPFRLVGYCDAEAWLENPTLGPHLELGFNCSSHPGRAKVHTGWRYLYIHKVYEYLPRQAITAGIRAVSICVQEGTTPKQWQTLPWNRMIYHSTPLSDQLKTTHLILRLSNKL